MAEELDEEKISSNERIIQIIFAMMDGARFSYREIMDQYQVKYKTALRDIKLVKKTFDGSDSYEYHYDNETRQHCLDKLSEIPFEKILSIMKVLIGTRTFTRNELDYISYDLLQTMGTQDSRKLGKTLTTISSHYRPVHTSEHLLGDVLEFNNWVNNQIPIKFSYKSSEVDGHIKFDRMALPLSLYFSGSYFYVVMYLPDENDEKNGVTYPFRIDRFVDKKPLPHVSITVPREKFEDEDTIRAKTFKMNSGNDIFYQFSYRGYPQMALDQLPKAKMKLNTDGSIYHDADGGVILEGHLSFNGALMWAIDQGSKVKVLFPNTLIKAVKKDLQENLNQY